MKIHFFYYDGNMIESRKFFGANEDSNYSVWKWPENNQSSTKQNERTSIKIRKFAKPKLAEEIEGIVIYLSH